MQCRSLEGSWPLGGAWLRKVRFDNQLRRVCLSAAWRLAHAHGNATRLAGLWEDHSSGARWPQYVAFFCECHSWGIEIVSVTVWFNSAGLFSLNANKKHFALVCGALYHMLTHLVIIRLVLQEGWGTEHS